MKRIAIVIVICLALPSAMQGQGMSMDRFFDKYSSRKDFTSLVMTGEFMKMMSGTALDGVNSMRSLVSQTRVPAFETDAKFMAAYEKFKVVTSLSDRNESLHFYVREKKGKKGKTTEYLLLMFNDDSGTVIYIEGNIDLKTVTRIAGMGQ